MKNISSLAVSVILAVSTMVAGAEAKSKATPVMEATIPFSFQLGSRTLPAGNYKFELATGLPSAGDSVSVLIVRNREAGIYQALAVPVKPGIALENESSIVFTDGDQHALVAVWEKGNRLDIQPGMLEASSNVDDWSTGGELLSVVTRNLGF